MSNMALILVALMKLAGSPRTYNIPEPRSGNTDVRTSTCRGDVGKRLFTLRRNVRCAYVPAALPSVQRMSLILRSTAACAMCLEV